MNWIKNLGVAAVAALAIGWGGAAQANLITTANASTTEIVINASCSAANPCNGGSLTSPVSAQAILSGFVFSNNNNTITFNVALTNTTVLSPATAGVDLTAFGFNTAPATTASGGDNQFTIYNDDNFPGFNNVQVCASSGPNCAGGQNDGLFPGQTDNFSVTITGVLNGSIDLGTSTVGGAETYDFKIAGSLGSVEFSGPGTPCVPGTVGCVVNPPTNVPEPTSLALFGTAMIAFGGLVMWRRRKNSTTLPMAA